MSLRSYLNKIKPSFEEGGKLHAFKSVFDGFETFLYVPNTTAKSGAHIHDAIDSKRIMSMVVIALIPALLFGMYNVGYQNYLAAGTLQEAGFFSIFFYGFLAVLPKILVSYIVGLGIEFIWAQWKGEEIQEGYLVSGIIIPLIVPVGCPLWILAIACAFAVIFAKEIFGGTGMNIFNVALVARAFLFFSYPQKMSGDTVWIATDKIFGLGNTLPDGFTTECRRLGYALRYDHRFHPWLHRRDKHHRHRHRSGHPAHHRHRLVENHVQRLCGWCRHGPYLLGCWHDSDSFL